MKLKSHIPALLAIAAVLCCGHALAAQDSAEDQMTRAVFDVYNKIINENPGDYEAWLNRANAYYSRNEYMRALNDVDKALELIPAKEADLRVQAYLMRANIFDQTGRRLKALEDLNSALAIKPEYYVAVYQRANVNYELGNYTQARDDYRRLLRGNSRSPEALIGLARIAVKENNLGLANEYLDQAVAADPNDADLYVRRASVRRLMNNDRGAVDDLILALSTDSRNSRATSDLIKLSNENYPAVIDGLTSAISQAPNVGMFPYLRAFIAQAHHRYTAALADYQSLIDRNLYNYHGIYASMAECDYALGNYQRALDNIDRALSMDRNTASHFIVRSKILRALKRFDEARDDAAKALAFKGDNTDALLQMGLCYVSLQNYAEAANLFGEATMSRPLPLPFMMRAWVLETYLNQPVAASGFYNQVVELPETSADSPDSLHGFALLFSGHTDEAMRWMQTVLDNNTDPDGYINYLATCLYAQAGDTDRAFSCMQKSLENGYADYHNWTADDDARINVAPIREDLRFHQLMQRYAIIFGR